jgi:hypothetical protein
VTRALLSPRIGPIRTAPYRTEPVFNPWVQGSSPWRPTSKDPAPCREDRTRTLVQAEPIRTAATELLMRLGCAGLHPALRGRHNVTMPRRELIPLAACIAALALTACTTDSSSAASPRLTRSESGTSRSSPHAHASYRPGVVYASRSAHVYRGTETFCLRSPLSGTARYSFHAGRASFTLDIHGFPAKTGVGLDWINNPVRGDLVGTFSTDASGSYVGAAQTFRPGEVRAVAVKFERSDGSGLPGIGKPC